MDESEIVWLDIAGIRSRIEVETLSASEVVEAFLSRIDRLSSLAGRFPRLANLAITNGLMRWVMEKTLGIAQGPAQHGVGVADRLGRQALALRSPGLGQLGVAGLELHRLERLERDGPET